MNTTYELITAGVAITIAIAIIVIASKLQNKTTASINNIPKDFFEYGTLEEYHASEEKVLKLRKRIKNAERMKFYLYIFIFIILFRIILTFFGV